LITRETVLIEQPANRTSLIVAPITPPHSLDNDDDIREFARPPLQRESPYVEKMFRSFELCAAVRADMLSVESTGGKALHDDAILNGDLHTAAFALGVLGSRDMLSLWEHIVEIAAIHGCVPAGDSACGFGNTAMVLAGQRCRFGCGP
jgi:methanol--5-hydroxybenzimidazolylcobamide Co-methyltransferase